MAGLKALVSGIEEGGGEWRRLMWGNEGGLDASIFLFRWRRRGHRGGGARPAGGGTVRARLRCGRKKKGGRLGRAGGLGRPEGRGPVGRGGKIDQKKRRLSRKARWAESDGENSFLNKI
jgi:hypothetical protein